MTYLTYMNNVEREVVDAAAHFVHGGETADQDAQQLARLKRAVADWLEPPGAVNWPAFLPWGPQSD